MHTSCFWPSEKFEPPSSTGLYTFFLVSLVSSSFSLIWSHKFTFFSDSAIYSSVYSLKGSMFSLMFPVNKVGSCGIIVTLCLRLCKPTYAMFSWSKTIYPRVPSSFFASYKILKNPKVIVDFPLPVLPTIPIFALESMSNEMFLITVGSSGLYL